MSSSKYYKDLNFIRLLSCIAVLLYHFNILKGGYLAVCIFFVLSGYLSCVSAFSKQKFKLLSYYYNRFKKIYLPLIIVVFITIGFLALTSNELWLNLKVETNSVLFGYNNFWQINANLDYFARHIDSPFIHLWYISILIQFELLFPLIYLFFKKIGDKFGKLLPCILIFFISILFTINFYFMSISSTNIMIVYYNTFCRIFSLLLGVSLGFIHSYYGPLVLKKINITLLRFVQTLYFIILTYMFIYIDSTSKWFSISMIIVSLITCRLIDYSTICSQKNYSMFDKFVKSLSGISYEIYLLQYPIIYFFQNIKMNNSLKILIMTIIILIISYILKFSLNIKKDKKFNIIRILILTIIISISMYGFYNYLISKDYTDDIRALEKQLEENQKIFEQKQQEYMSKFKQEEENWLLTLNDLENNEKQLETVVKKLPIVGIGDSIMLGAVNELYKQFPNGYFDAQTSRTAWVANGILQNLKNNNILGNVILINLGANGDCPESIKESIMNTIGNKKVFWVNVTNDDAVNVNNNLLNFSKKYDNLYIIDWNSISTGHPEYFIWDGIHLSDTGKKVYIKTIYDSIYKVYLQEFEEKKQEIINKHEEKLKNKITFYGDKILLNLFNNLQGNYSNSNYVIKGNLNYNILKEILDESIKNNSLTTKNVFLLDSDISIKKEELQSLIEILNGKETYIISMNKNLSNNLYELNQENIKIIDFYEKINNNKEYLSIDGIHLTELGNNALLELLNNELSK